MSCWKNVKRFLSYLLTYNVFGVVGSVAATTPSAPLPPVCIERTGGQTWIGQRADLPVSCLVSSSSVPHVAVTWFPHSASIGPLLKVYVLKEKFGLTIKLHSWNVGVLRDTNRWKIFRKQCCIHPKEIWDVSVKSWFSYSTKSAVTCASLWLS
jgi:hypothetical protein